MSELVSVIIPAYNGDRYLTEAIDSVLQQSYSNIEIIVVDDGSTDQTQQHLRSYGSRIRSIYQTNQGVAAARNCGFQLAQGKYVAFLDQDDVLLPDKIALQVDCFQSNLKVGIVHSGWRLVDAEKNFLSDIKPWQDAPILDLAGWFKRMPVLLSAMLFRRSWLVKVGKFDSRFIQACDLDLVQRLVLLGCETAWVQQVVVLYRQHDRNDSLNTLIQAKECWEVRQQGFAFDLPATVRAIESECYYHTLVWIGWRLFHTGHLAEMKFYLEKAFQYRPATWTEMIMQWIDRFQQYEAEYGGQFDVERLTRSAEWQQLMQNLMSNVAANSSAQQTKP